MNVKGIVDVIHREARGDQQSGSNALFIESDALQTRAVIIQLRYRPLTCVEMDIVPVTSPTEKASPPVPTK